MIYNKLPAAFESSETISYALADSRGVILSFECLTGRYLTLFQGIGLDNAEDIIRTELGESYDGADISLVMMLQSQIEQMIDACEDLAGFDILTGDPLISSLRFDKYHFPTRP